MLHLIYYVYICNKIALSKCTRNEENYNTFLRYFRNLKCDNLFDALSDFSASDCAAIRHESQSIY